MKICENNMKKHVVSNNQGRSIKNQKQNDLDEDITRILETLGFKIISTENSDNIDELERLYANYSLERYSIN